MSDVRVLARGASSYDVLVREDFHGAAEMRRRMMARFDEAAEVRLLPPAQVPDLIELAKLDELLRGQLEKEYGSLEAQERRMREAFA